MLQHAINRNFEELAELLKQLSPHEYRTPCAAIGGSSIGEHIRHVIEMYQILESGYEAGTVDYSLRERNRRLETETDYALSKINALRTQLDKPDKPLELVDHTDGNGYRIRTNYYRELLYNLEHSIHHQALIKVASRECSVVVSENFGVARSTVEYRRQCAQ